MNKLLLRAISRISGLLVFCVFGSVVAQTNPAYNPPAGYYSGTSGKTGTALKSALNGIIRNHTVIPYTASSTDVWNALKVLDEDPGNPSNVLLVYNGVSWPKSDTNGDGNNDSTSASWNREHCWPMSYGLDDSGPDFSDLFNLRACRSSVNSSRNNRLYDVPSLTHPTDPAIAPPNCPECLYDYDEDQGGLWAPRISERGDIARAMFYMAVRYDGRDSRTLDLELGDSPNVGNGVFGKLSILLSWSAADPVSEVERRRNHLIYTQYQGNRNPFIDNPEMVAKIFGGAPATPVIALSVNPASLDEGTSATGTASISTTSASPLLITLSKTGDASGSEISMPASVTIPAGQLTVNFTINALTDGVVDGDKEVGISAQASGYDSGFAQVEVLDVDEMPGGNSATNITGPGFYTQNFDTLPGSDSQTWTDNSSIPGWYAQRTGDGTTITASTGSTTTGGLYSFGTTTDRALGSLGSGSAGSFAWGVSFRNSTAGPLTLTTLAYAGEQWRNSAASGQTANFSYQIGNAAITNLTPSGDTGWTAVTALNFTSPVTGGTSGLLNGNLSENRSLLSANLNLQLQPGQWITFRWRDIDHTGGDHGLAVDDFRLDWSLPVLPDAPEITSPLAASGEVGATFAYTITALNEPEFFEAESLPEGLSLNGTTGVISGTPAEAGQFDITILAGNDGGVDTKMLTLTVNPATTTFALWSGGAASTPALLTKYAIGGAASPAAGGESSTVETDNGILIITAIIRIEDPDLTVIGEATADLAAFGDPGALTLVSGTAVGVSQAGVPAGCQRQEFRAATDGVRHFMRLRINHDP